MTTTLDIRHVTCPLTWVRTKLALEAMAPGEELLVLLGDPEAMENVPRSVRDAGHDVTVEDAALRIIRR